MSKDYMKRKRLVSLALAGVLTFSASGCSVELGSDKTDMDMLDTNTLLEDGDNLSSGISQTKEVDGEKFKLVIDYFCDEGREWRITDTKSLAISIRTEGLPSNKEVYIDNIHTDTTIVSTKAYYDGILQDSMDDRIHNSLMMGFPIDDKTSYFGYNVIEGQNLEFIEGFTYGYNRANSTSVESKRYLESDFLESGVYANQIDSVIDLIIVDKDTLETRTVSVLTNLLIKVCNKITFIEDDKYVVYEYDMDGNKTKLEEISSKTLKK